MVYHLIRRGYEGLNTSFDEYLEAVVHDTEKGAHALYTF